MKRIALAAVIIGSFATGMVVSGCFTPCIPTVHPLRQRRSWVSGGIRVPERWLLSLARWHRDLRDSQSHRSQAV